MPNTPATETSSRGFSRKDAESGDPVAQFGLGLFYAAGAAPQDYAQAMVWYQKAADQNHHLAQFNLGQMYALGHGMPKSDSIGLMWIRRAAQGGDAGAQFDLGDRYARASLHGTEMDVVESRIEAYKWFTLAAAQEYGTASLQCDHAAMRMTHDELTEAQNRVTLFRPTITAPTECL